MSAYLVIAGCSECCFKNNSNYFKHEHWIVAYLDTNRLTHTLYYDRVVKKSNFCDALHSSSLQRTRVTPYFTEFATP